MTVEQVPDGDSGNSTSWTFRLGAAGLIGLTVLLLAVSGNAVVALVPVILMFIAWASWRLPIGVVCSAVLFLLLAADNVKENPGMGLYKSFLYMPGKFLYTALSESGVPGMKLFGIEVILFAMGALAFLRWVLAKRALDEEASDPASPFMRALRWSMATILLLEVWGVLRGGDVRFSLLQFRPMLMTSMMGLVFASSFRSRREVWLLLGVLVSVAVLRSSLGIYYWWTIMRLKFFGSDSSGDGTYVTTHSDSILSGVVVVAVLMAVVLKPNLKSGFVAAVVLPLVGFGIHVNNRRLAIVAVGISLLVVYLIGDHRIKGLVHRCAMVLVPAIVIYIGAGWNAGGAWAKPVQTLKSVTQSSDESSKTRDIENYNLVQTIRKNMFLGSGFGHKYDEVVVAYDISHAFEAYRYVPHNSILGLFAAGGALGFAGYWGFCVVGIFLAVRTYRRATSSLDQVVCLTAISAVVQYGVLSWGDMGLQSCMASMILACTLGAVAQIATRIGAWSNDPSHDPQDDAPDRISQVVTMRAAPAPAQAPSDRPALPSKRA